MEQKPSHEWTEAEKQEYNRRCRLKEIFIKYDTDKSGTLEESELYPLVRDAFAKAEVVTMELVRKHTKTVLFKHDKDKSGKIEFEEFVSLYAQLLESPELPINIRLQTKQADITYNPEASTHKFERPEYVFTETEKKAALELFNKHDKDNSGSIEKNELRELLKEKMGARTSEAILNRFVDSHFSEFDKEETGSISQSEFMKFYRKLYCNPTKKPAGAVGLPIGFKK
eukprot:TRINITY_DN15011_c0_g1_i1.p1 TRINITY_DN15011_c0_g1~~TRINITY_DN15011_c0_g1_i1.p1  ORF type:complete len:227 (+),score=47.19 TRINITY_DN15011_c0_g1_i1:50-730(+)